jgi:hypothetical protein
MYTDRQTNGIAEGGTDGIYMMDNIYFFEWK